MTISRTLRTTLLLLTCVMFVAPVVTAGESACTLPPVMKRQYGKIRVIHSRGAKKVRFHSWKTRNRGVTRIVAPKSATNEEVAALLLNDFWNGKFHDRTLPEMAPINRDVFVAHGVKMLTAQKSDASPLIHDWWNVRMGEPLRISKTHQLVAVNIYHDDGGMEVGHFCLGVRKIGGDAENDFIIDMRAPWLEDRAATTQEALNHDNSLINQLIPNNMYDWLYTQAEFRGCRNELWFCPISDAQVRLLRTVVDEDKKIKSGPFRPLKGNCATLGEAILDRVLPFDQQFGDGPTIIDIPRPTALQTIKRFGGEIVFIILHAHQREGMEPTSASKIHPAPNRAKSAEFLQLQEVPKIN